MRSHPSFLFNCTFPCLQKSHSATETVLQAPFLSFFHSRYTGRSLFYSFLPSLLTCTDLCERSVIHSWVREENRQEEMDLGLRENKFLAPNSLEKMSRQFSCDANSLLLVERFGCVHRQSHKSTFSWGSVGIYLWLA